jgi:hypothetical protein
MDEYTRCVCACVNLYFPSFSTAGAIPSHTAQVRALGPGTAVQVVYCKTSLHHTDLHVMVPISVCSTMVCRGPMNVQDMPSAHHPSEGLCLVTCFSVVTPACSLGRMWPWTPWKTYPNPLHHLLSTHVHEWMCALTSPPAPSSLPHPQTLEEDR